jgi:hypothetical protein
MTSNAAAGQGETAAIPGDEVPSADTSTPGKPGQPDVPSKVQPVDQAAQEDAAEERATNGGYN